MNNSAAPRHPSSRSVMMAFIGMGAVYFFAFFLRTAIPGTIFNELQAEFRLSAASVAALGSMFIGIYAWMQLFAGISADRFGGTRMLVFGGLIMGVGTLLFPLSHSLWMLYLTRAVTGFGSSFMYLSVMKEIDLLFAPRRFPMMAGIALTFGYCGGIFAMLPFERAVALAGWRAPVALVGVLVLVCVLLLVRLLPRMTPFAPVPGRPVLRPVRDIILNRAGWPLLVCAVINFPVYFVVQAAFGKKFLQDFAGLSSPHAAAFTMVMMMVGAAASLAGGFLPGWCGHRRRPVILGASVILFASILLLLAGIVSGAPPWFFLFAYILLAIPSGAVPASIACMKELNRPENAALSIGIVNAVTYLGVSVFMAVAGMILDRFPGTLDGGAVRYPAGAYLAIFAWLALMGLVSVIAAFRIKH